MNTFAKTFICCCMKKLAIVGVSGLVGQSVLDVLKEERIFEKMELIMISSDRSAGKEFVYCGRTYKMIELNEKVFELGIDYAIFVVGEDISKVWVPRFSERGIVVIDNSSAFRLAKNVPLVVPEINLSDIKSLDKIIANPNCSTIQLVIVLDKLRKIAGLDTVVVSSYQSVSGAGRDALLDLENKTRKVFECGINDNFIARIGSIAENMNCSEENKIILETQKILGEKVNVVATTVRVPIRFCHGESVYVKFKGNVDANKIKESLACEYIKISDDLFYPSECAGSNLTYVCRLRQHSENEILFFVIADNLRRGASFNAVEILKRLIENKEDFTKFSEK